jgi:very-short-patch-repair endonuclease
VGYVKITPYVQDRKNALLVRLLGDWKPQQLVSVKNALKRGIEVAFQLDGSEIAAELMPNEESATALLLYEAAEGGAGVLSRLVESPAALKEVGKTALEICHWGWSGELPSVEAGLENTDVDCEAGCYRCLLGYHNQRDHDLIDRRSPELKQFLLDLSRSELVGQGGRGGRSVAIDRLLAQAGSALERLWLETLFRHGHHLPDAAQQAVPGHYVVPDFTYKQACAVVFIDGPHHQQPLQQRLDAEKRSALLDAGITVVVFTQDTTAWPAVLSEYNWLFGGGLERPTRQPEQPAKAGSLGDALDAVFAQHGNLLGGGS